MAAEASLRDSSDEESHESKNEKLAIAPDAAFVVADIIVNHMHHTTVTLTVCTNFLRPKMLRLT